ncbi:MAG: cobyrinate a,c-diamide synthase [Candidatus Puniceispirillaceae bacterium]
MAKSGLIIGAASSNAGKTLITTGLLAAFHQKGISVAGAKTGPDYIDPAFHYAACDIPSVNLDPFAMPDDLLAHYARRQPADHILIEGVMGLFDGAVGVKVSTSSLADSLSLPVILIMNVRGQSQTAGYIAGALAKLQPHIAGVILNEVGSARHRSLIEDVLREQGLTCFGGVPTSASLAVPSRHLGLVQMAELAQDPSWSDFITHAGKIMSDHCDLDAIAAAFGPLPDESLTTTLPPPPAQNITVVRDEAFGFSYQHHLTNWRSQGAEITFVSALADDAIPMSSDFVFLPGGYPELHLPKLSQSSQFLSSLRQTAKNGISLYGECGGYMSLGEAIIDKDGKSYEMANLLPLVTSFEDRKRHLGYRRIGKTGATPDYLSHATSGHEFHFTSAVKEQGDALFEIADAAGNALGKTGLRQANVSGSYIHII